MEQERSREALEAALQALALSEDEAVTLFNLLAERFDWAGSPWVTGDIRSALAFYMESGEEFDGVAVTDGEWAQLVARVKASWEWRKGIGERTAEHGNEMLDGPALQALRALYPLAETEAADG